MNTLGIEAKIANALADRLFALVVLTSSEPSPKQYRAALDDACKSVGFVPNDDEQIRIWFDVVNIIGERRRAANKLNQAIVQSTSDLTKLKAKANSNTARK
jgi:hypothetical protein